MGCTGSKLDDLPAVILCRERCNYLDEAIKQRYAFSEAHVAYLNALKSVGVSLDRFFSQDLDGPIHGGLSPVLNLPKVRKGYPDPVRESGSDNEKVHHHLHSGSHSDSGSHLHFHSDDEDSDGGTGSGTGSENPHDNHLHFDDDEFNEPVYTQPVQYEAGFFPGYEGLNLNGNNNGGFMNVNYMKKGVTQSVVYTQRPMSVETMHIGESSNSASASTSYNNSYSSNNNNYSSFDYNSNFNGYANYGGGGGGFFSGSGGSVVQNEAFSRREEPPPPPPPPSGSNWEFLNPFDSFEKYYPTYPSSRDSREVREEEGIPDLEDEDDEVVVKEVHGDNHKYNVDSGRSSFSKPRVSGEEDGNLHYKVEKDPPEFEVHLVDKKVVERSNDRENGKAHGGRFEGDADVLREIQVQFERASDSETGLAKVLEVGKVPYKQKHGHVSAKILHLPVMSSTPRSAINSDQGSLDGEQELELRSKNLSSTLHKLYLWEKKLYEEVKSEEKMRVDHEQKSRRLKRLDERGAESNKIDSTRTMVRNLSTRIRMAIQVVDRISVKINSLRDDELWPQLNEFIQGLSRMWKSMLECHQSQCQAIAEAKRLDAIAIRNNLSVARVEATRQLEQDLINWTSRFSHWVGTQKAYVRALNNWLMKCLLYEPEETPDGVVPFSPGRIGAPPVFIVCNQWWQSLEQISEREVIDSMRELALNVLQLWDRDKVAMRQQMLASKDERKIKSLEKDDQRIHKDLQALDKRVVLNENGMPLTGHVYQSETNKSGGLQASLLHVFEALERFTTDSLKVYEDLLRRIDEDHLGKSA